MSSGCEGVTYKYFFLWHSKGALRMKFVFDDVIEVIAALGKDARFEGVSSDPKGALGCVTWKRFHIILTFRFILLF